MILFLGMYTKKAEKRYSNKYTYMHILTALFAIIIRWKQPKYLITTEWINKGVISIQ